MVGRCAQSSRPSPPAFVSATKVRPEVCCGDVWEVREYEAEAALRYHNNGGSDPAKVRQYAVGEVCVPAFTPLQRYHAHVLGQLCAVVQTDIVCLKMRFSVRVGLRARPLLLLSTLH